MKKLLLISALGLFAFGSAFAANVDLKQSSLEWHGSKVTGKHYGKVLFKSAKVTQKDGKLTGGEFVVDMKSITISDLQGEWAKKFLGHISNEDFFTVNKYPTSKLKIKSVKGNKVTADLTIKDKTNEVKFDVKQTGNTYAGTMKFDRTKFGMIYGSGDFFKGLGDKMVHNEVKVNFKFTVKK